MRTPNHLLPIVLLVSVLVGAPACQGLPPDVGRTILGAGGGALDDGTIADGLREALRVGTERAVGKTSQIDGFLGNRLIRIAMPDDVRKMTDTLRKIGLGAQVDELETSMNRAAEKASGEAVDVFWDAVSSMTIDDARRVLEGGKHSATKLLRERTSGELTRRFQPIVKTKMDEVGLSRLYGDLAAQYNALPLVRDKAPDLDTYVTDRTLDGLFTMLGKEEERIREDPVARTTELLRRVFE